MCFSLDTAQEELDTLKYEKDILLNKIQYFIDFANYAVENKSEIKLTDFCKHMLERFEPLMDAMTK